MEMYNVLGTVIPNMVTIYIFLSFLGTLFQPKYQKNVYRILYVGIVIFQCGMIYLRIPFLSLVTFICIAVILVKVAYKKEKETKSIYVVAFMIYLTFIDMIVVPVYSQITGATVNETLSHNEKFFITGIISAIIMTCTYKFVVQMICSRKVTRLTKNQEIFVVFLGGFELLVVHMILQFKNYSVPESNKIVVWVLLGFVVIDIYMLKLFEKVSANNELLVKNSLLEQEQCMNLKYLEGIEMQNEKYRRIMHDVRKHLQVLKHLESVDETYCREMIRTLDDGERNFKCTNHILNIIINDKLLSCEQKGIDFQIDMDDVELAFMNKMDITTIFLNLLNNAVEACDEIEAKKRYIAFKVKNIKGNIVVIIKNSCKENGSEKFVESVSTKRGHMGLGITNVRMALENYESNLILEQEGEEFTAKFIILEKFAM